MSWKGVVKAVERLPAMVKSRTNMLSKTHDPEFVRLEIEFTQMEADMGQLLADAQRYRCAVAANVQHQVRFANTLVEMYTPTSNASRSAGMPGGTVVIGGVDAAEFARELNAAQSLVGLNRALEERLSPYLARVDTEVIAPVKEITTRLASVRKLITKREHKVLDNDRHQDTLRRLRESKKNSAGAAGAMTAPSYDEQQKISKAEAVATQAAQALQAHAAPLLEQLPILLSLRGPFTAHLTALFAHLQMGIFTSMSQTMQEFSKQGLVSVSEDIPVMAEYQRGREELDRIVRGIALLNPTLVGAVSGNAGGNAGSAPAAMLGDQKVNAASAVSMGSPYSAAGPCTVAPPPYTSSTTFAKSPPMLPPLSAPQPDRFVTAQFDFEAQSAGDLGFHTGDQIRVIESTASREDWWRGELGGRQGNFPANYTSDAV